jgi:phospholipid/cholesterol/gamma-HCH transport system substrate-binding protein
MSKRTIEIAVGIFIATGIAALFMLAMKVSNLSAFDAKAGYELKANFENIGGLKVRSPVRIGGVRIGRVVAIDYNSEHYEAVVTMSIDKRYNKLPFDTEAGIFTAGLLGEQYIGLEPGGDEEFLQDGSEISETTSAIVLEKMIGNFLFEKSSESK